MSVVSFPLACVDAGLQGISGEIETIGCLYSWQIVALSHCPSVSQFGMPWMQSIPAEGLAGK